jgi:hypothetical protein
MGYEERLLLMHERWAAAPYGKILRENTDPDDPFVSASYQHFG